MHVPNVHSVVNSIQIRKRPAGITGVWACVSHPVCILVPQAASADALIILPKIREILKLESVVDVLLVVPSIVWVYVAEHVLVHVLLDVGTPAFNHVRIIANGNVPHRVVLDVCKDVCLDVRISVPHVKMFVPLLLEQKRHVTTGVLHPVCMDVIKIVLQTVVPRCVDQKDLMHVMQIAV